MTVLIDNKSGLPIYDQIFTQIKAQIISGELDEDELVLLSELIEAGAGFTVRRVARYLRSGWPRMVK